MVPPFRYAQASQLFINLCFALALTGVIWLVQTALDANSDPSRLHNILHVPLLIYLVFVIWRQYGSYYMPVQHYLDHEESEIEDFTTFLITAVLGCYPIVCVYMKNLSPFILIMIILLNMLKVSQMNRHLGPDPALAYARSTLKEFSKRLRFYAVTVLLILYPPILSYSEYLERSDWLASVTFGLAPLMLFLFASFFWGACFSPGFQLDPWKFHATIFSASAKGLLK